MQPNEFEQLQAEQIKGAKAERIYETYVVPFIKAKKEILFKAFNDLPISATEDLAEVKRMNQTIDAFAQEFLTFIETGKMADVILSREMDLTDQEKH